MKHSNHEASAHVGIETLPTELEIRSDIENLRHALLSGPKAPNIWTYFSIKNRCLLTLTGDVTYIQAMLLEGDCQVRNYSIPNSPGEDKDYSYGRNLLAVRHDGTKEWILCGRYESLIKSIKPSLRGIVSATKVLAESLNAVFTIKTESDFKNRFIEFWNLVTLCGIATRARDQAFEYEHRKLIESLNNSTGVTIGSLIKIDSIDPALMLAAIANGILHGYVHSDIKNISLSKNTILSKTSAVKQSAIPLEELISSAIPTNITTPLPINRRTAKVPDRWRDLELWPKPKVDVIQNEKRYREYKIAVEMYMYERADEDILRETGITHGWARKLFLKCIKQNADGQINGYRALLKYRREKDYVRTAALPESNVHLSNTGGYAGAFGTLLRRFPDELLKLFEIQVLANRELLINNKQQIKIRPLWTILRDEIHQFLKNNGVKKSEYPFNTVDEGYGAICSLARGLLYRHPSRFMRARSGVDAAQKLGIGYGYLPLIRAIAPFQVLEADFHKHDSAVTVGISTPTRGTIFAPVPRFWIGCMVDTFNKAIVGSTDSYEEQTTISCVLDLIDSAIQPPDPDKNIMYARVSSDGKWLPNQVFSEYSFHGWDILRLDRAWAHYSHDVISAIVSTVGCAICFSKPRTWWSRVVMERTFLDLTTRGAQCLPTTTGSNPTDSKRNEPEKNAISLHFEREEMCRISRSIIRELNESGKQGAFYEAPLKSLLRTGELPNYCPRPLPIARTMDRPTLWIIKKIKIEASIEQVINPSVRTHNCRFRGGRLGESWDLVGKFVWLAISRRDINNAKVYEIGSGQLIDQVVPEKQWVGHVVPWATFCMIQKYGRRQSWKERPPSSINDFKNSARKIVETSKPSKAGKNAASIVDRIDSMEISKNNPGSETNGNGIDGQDCNDNYSHSIPGLNDAFGSPPDIE